MKLLRFHGHIEVEDTAEDAQRQLSLAITKAFPGYGDYSLTTSVGVQPESKESGLIKTLMSFFYEKDKQGRPMS